MSANLLSFLAFAIAASATPGPNNLLVLATAARRGLRSTVPLIGGIALGFGFMVAVVGAGLAGPLASHPVVHTAMRWAGAAWMLVLSWQIATSEPTVTPGAGDAMRSLGFWGACAFQWINPKAWVMAVATAATYTVPGDDVSAQVLTLAALFVIVSLPCTGAWALVGVRAGALLTTPSRMVLFNRIMGLLLAVSVVLVLFEW